MTRMAVFRQREGRRDEAAGRYFWVDYITHHVIGSIVCATVAFMVGCALYILSHFDLLMQDIYSTDLTEFLTRAIRLYVVLTACYCVFSTIVYAVRYYRMQRRIRRYSAGLRKLMDMADREEMYSRRAQTDREMTDDNIG